jgi:putative phosphoribosyl transferase
MTMRYSTVRAGFSSEERIPVDGITLDGNLTIPEGATGIVLFAHGSGSSRFSPRNRAVAADLHAAGIATLLLDLLTVEEEKAEAATRHLRFNIELLASRLGSATDWIGRRADTRALQIGYFGASTGAAAALVAASRRRHIIRAIVSRGGRPDLAGHALGMVQAATLLIVGGLDTQVIALNEEAYRRLVCVKHIDVVPGATHLFEEAGALEHVSRVARQWFDEYLTVKRPETAAPTAAW